MALVLMLALGVSSCASSRSSKGEITRGREGLEAKELEIGRQIHEEVLSSFYLYTEPRLVEYVNKVAGSLSAHAERQDFKYRVTVLLSEKVFATSSPGGYIYITTGFLDFLENEAQLAAVLAHEIGQIQYRNPKLSSSRKAIEAMTATGAAVGGFFGDIGVLAVLGLTAIDAMTNEKSKEERVYMADRLVLKYMVAVGYDPQCWMDVLEKIASFKDGNVIYIFDYYSSRPITEKRVQRLGRSFKRTDLAGRMLEVRGTEYLTATQGVREIYRGAGNR